MTHLILLLVVNLFQSIGGNYIVLLFNILLIKSKNNQTHLYYHNIQLT